MTALGDPGPLALLTPVEVDRLLIHRWEVRSRAGQAVEAAVIEARYAAGQQLRYRDHTFVWDGGTVEDAMAYVRTERTGSYAKVNAAQAEYGAADLDVREVDYEYDRRPWARFYLVPDGHLHSSTCCHTCNKAGKQTSFRLVADLSGSDEATAVAEYGSMLCTVCYSSAPVEWTDGSTVGRIAAADRDARTAEKATKLAAKLEKALLPDGAPLALRGYDRPKTLIAGQRALSSTLRDLAYYGAGHPASPVWTADAQTLAAAVGAKTGREATAVLEEACRKVAKREGVVAAAHLHDLAARPVNTLDSSGPVG